MVDERRNYLARDDPPDSSSKVAFKRCSRKIWADRESGRAISRPSCLHLSARSTRLSALHVSPCRVYVARDRSPTVDSRSQYGGDHGRRFVCRLCYLVECSATARTTVALSAWRKALSGFKSFKRFKSFKTFETERSG